MNVELSSRTADGGWELLLRRDKTLATDVSFALLVERHSRFVFRIAYAVLRNLADAEDVVQETFLKLFRTNTWEDLNDERAYLARMAWRLSVSRAPLRRFGSEAETREIACSERSPETAAIDTEQSRTIHRLIDALPEKLRRPLALSALEEMTTTQVAILMDVPESTVRRLLAEARALVKEKMLRMEGKKHA